MELDTVLDTVQATYAALAEQHGLDHETTGYGDPPRTAKLRWQDGTDQYEIHAIPDTVAYFPDHPYDAVADEPVTGVHIELHAGDAFTFLGRYDADTDSIAAAVDDAYTTLVAGDL